MGYIKVRKLATEVENIKSEYIHRGQVYRVHDIEPTGEFVPLLGAGGEPIMTNVDKRGIPLLNQEKIRYEEDGQPRSKYVEVPYENPVMVNVVMLILGPLNP